MARVTDIESRTGKKRLPVRKQHSNEAWERATQAYELRVGGKSLSEIAEVMGLTSDRDVCRLLEERYAYDAAYLANMDRKSILGQELLRLDKLQAAAWPAAMMGDPKSIDSCIKIINQRAKICGLEQVDPVVQKNLVLVVGEDEDAYIAALRAASDD